MFEDKSCLGATTDEFNIQELREENAALREQIKILEEHDKTKMEDLNELREENAALRQQIKIQSEGEKHNTNDLKRLRDENAAYQQAHRMLEEEKLKIIEKLKQISKKKCFRQSIQAEEKREIKKKNEICVPVPMTAAIQVPTVPEMEMKTEITHSVKLTDFLNALTMKTMKIKEFYVELRKLKEELAKVHNMSSVAGKLFENENLNHSKPANGRRYTDFIRNLSVNLSFYSQAGYEKLRTIFTLPSLTSIKNHLLKLAVHLES